MNENNDPPTMDLTCYDGTKLTIPDDNFAIKNLGRKTPDDFGEMRRFTWNEIYVNSGNLSREARRKYVTFRPPLRKRLAVRAKQLWREFWS